jgi:hypothetical protein
MSVGGVSSPTAPYMRTEDPVPTMVVPDRTTFGWCCSWCHFYATRMTSAAYTLEKQHLMLDEHILVDNGELFLGRSTDTYEEVAEAWLRRAPGDAGMLRDMVVRPKAGRC